MRAGKHFLYAHIFVASVSTLWLILNLVFWARFTNLDFFGDGAWWSQAALRLIEAGWPSAPLSGVPQLYEVGWGPFTMWIQIGLLALSFKLFGLSYFSSILPSIIATALAITLAGFTIVRVGEGRPSALALFLFLAASPTLLAKAHSARPEALVMLWVSGGAFAILSGKVWLRRLGLIILPLCFWIHPLAIVIPTGLLLVFFYYNIKKELFTESVWLLCGVFGIFAASIIITFLAGNLELIDVIVKSYYTGVGPGWIARRWHLLLAGIIIGGFCIFWAIPRSGLNSRSPWLKRVLGGMVILPMLIAMRPNRIYQFTYPLLVLASYPIYLYISSKKRWLGWLFWAGLIGFLGLAWARSYIPTYFAQNPIYMAKAAQIAERNREIIASADSALFRLKGESVFFWFLPKRLQLGAARYAPGDPLPPKVLIFLPADSPPEDPSLSVIDSLDLGFAYSSYGRFSFTKVYLLLSE
ncbi:MAG: hypothetical protein ABIM74_05565 [candidate division WOR-3 bacterium]